LKTETKIFTPLKKMSGFTLLEVMVALSIISIVLVSIYKLHADTLRMNQMTRFYSTAPLLAQRKLAEIKNNTLEELSSDSGGFEENFPGYNWRVTISDVESEVLGSAAKNLKKIDIVVGAYGTELSYDLRAYWSLWRQNP
jgi:general secretion pathway protein I